MNLIDAFYAQYADITLLAACLPFSLWFTLRSTGKQPLRKGVVFFWVLGTSIVLMGMVGHLSENCYRAVAGVLKGTFVYTYHFYSLILMGLVFFALCCYMLGQIKAFCWGEPQGRRRFLKAALLLVALSLPTVPLTPIGVVPAFSCAISLAALPFATKRRKDPLLKQA